MKPVNRIGKDSSPARKRLRFRTWRPDCGPNYLRVDEAIDIIGAILFEAEWGRQPGFDQLPLFGNIQKAALFTLVRDKKGFKTAKLTNSTPNEVTLARQYREVYRTLRGGLRSSSVRAKAVTYAGETVRLKPEVFTTQKISIFGAGTVELAKERCPVWLYRRDFFEWIDEKVSPPKDIPEIARTALHELLTQEFSKGTIRSLNRRQIADLVKAGLGFRPTPAAVEDIIGNLPKNTRKGGRPLTDANWQALMKRLVPELDTKLLGPPTKAAPISK